MMVRGMKIMPLLH